MNTYLAIITTALVVTQIVRLLQNAIQLRRQNVLFKKTACGDYIGCSDEQTVREILLEAGIEVVPDD